MPTMTPGSWEDILNRNPTSPLGGFGGVGSTSTGTGGGGGGGGGMSIPNFSPGAPSNLDDITRLINALNVQGQTDANAARIPGAPELETQSSLNIGSLLRGQIPADVMRLLKQQAAERGVAIGSPGSPNETTAFLQALGKTGLDLQQLGQQNLTSALARNPAAPLYDPSNLVLTPYQAGSLTNQATQNQIEQQRVDIAREQQGLNTQQYYDQRPQAQKVWVLKGYENGIPVYGWSTVYGDYAA